MGIADALGKEDRIEIKVTEFTALLKNAVTADLLMNGIINHIPYSHIEVMVKGDSSLLTKYRDTGMDPSEISKMDKDYADTRAELAVVKAEKMNCEKQIEDLKHESQKLASEVSKQTEDYKFKIQQLEEELKDAYDWIKDKDYKGKLDIGKIFALRNAEWSIEEIAKDINAEADDVGKIIRMAEMVEGVK
ncbi:MAG: hypothetical protein IJI25_08840 [Eubacterium sp.]|nr:hypothetical protein [Eubacterium sp.]